MHSTSALKESEEGPSGNAYFVKVVASDHTSLEIPRKVKVHAIVRSHLRCEFPQIVGSGKWLLNYARNANKPIPVESAITTKKLNAPRRLSPMRLPNRVTSHQGTRKIEVRYDPEQLPPCDKIEGSSANDFPGCEHLLHLLESPSPWVLLPRSGIPHDEFFLVSE
jgi:hypothetical protein